MVNVSDRFITLAKQNGRHVFCRIEAGDAVFTDDDKIEFDFDDVAHPDWFTVGTACANRFYFGARFGGEIAVRAEVRPYISFDGEEWCPLGVFYVSRRYVRGNYVSIVCYDRLYSLDTEYSSLLSLPSDTVKVLGEICSQNGIECADLGDEYEVAEIPEGCTARDMIGYIAALNRACAKMDRSGALVLKKYDSGDYVLSEDNCMSISRNMAHSVVTCLKASTGNGELVSGNGAEISTLELYNPLMTQERLDQMLSLFKTFAFYGADIEMQGMPFLEAGERLVLLEKGLLYPLQISGIEYHYDGTLTAVLYSRNKSYTDAASHCDDLEKALEELRTKLGAACITQTNEQLITLSETPVTVAEFTFDAAEKAFARTDVNFTLDCSGAELLTISVYINGIKAERSAVRSISGAGRELLHWYHIAQGLPEGSSRITVTMATGSGSAYILPSQLSASLTVHGTSGNIGSIRDRQTASDRFAAAAACSTALTQLTERTE